MKQLGIVFHFELMGYVRKRSFRLLTVALVLLIAVVLSWPRISGLFGSGASTENETGGAGNTNVSTVALAAADGAISEDEVAYYNAMFEGSGTVFMASEADRSELEAQVDSEEYAAAVIITGPLSYERIVRNAGMYDSFGEQFDQVMLARYRAQSFEMLGVPAVEVEGVLAAGVQSEVHTTASGKDQSRNFFYTYILIFLLYFAIIMYGSFVSSSVATEKTTRAMELLITSTNPNSLMFGKVLGAGLAGLTQLVLILGSAFLFYNLNASYYADNVLVQSIFAMPISIVLYAILFFILGFFIYAFLYAAMSSIISRMEDLSTAIMPVTYLFIIAFVVVMMSMASGNVDSPLMVVCSFIPFTSPMAMFTRITMGNVPGWQVAVSVALLVGTTIGIGVLAAKIYRLGVLLYGKPPKIKELFSMLKAEKQNA